MTPEEDEILEQFLYQTFRELKNGLRERREEMGLSAFQMDVARGFAQGYPPWMVANQFGVPIVDIIKARKAIFSFFRVRDQFRLIEVLSDLRFLNSADVLELDYLKEQ